MADAWLLSSEGKDGILHFLAQKRDLAQKRQSYLISVMRVLSHLCGTITRHRVPAGTPVSFLSGLSFLSDQSVITEIR